MDDNGNPATGDDFAVGTITSLAAGESATLYWSGTAGKGLYQNNATATAAAVSDHAEHGTRATNVAGVQTSGLPTHLTLDKKTQDLGVLANLTDNGTPN